MVLEARALEPLHQHGLPALDDLLAWLADRHAEQRQALGLARAAPAVELQPVAAPVAPELRRDRVAGGGEVVRRARAGLSEGLPVLALRGQRLDTQAAE